MKKTKLLFVLLVLCFANINAQKQNEEFGFITDNDLYVSLILDRYYTNGLELFYRKAKSIQFKNFDKKITTYRIGQKIYNPFSWIKGVKLVELKLFNIIEDSDRLELRHNFYLNNGSLKL